MIGALLGLADVVARNAPVGPGDVRRTRNALARAGFIAKDGFAGGDFPSEGMFAGLKSFQRANGLREDGAMKPGGPTERLLANFGRRPARLDFTGTVGISAANRRADVTLARRALAASGHLQPDQVAGDISEADLSVGIQSFQRDFNLKRDGRITPGGETQNALGRVVEPGRERDGAMNMPALPIEPGQRRKENVNFSASNAAAKEPAEGESGAANPAKPDAAVKDFDGGGGGSHGDALKTRERSSGVVGELRDISEKGTKLTDEEKAAMLAKIEQAFPHESDRQRGMKSLLRASQMDRKRDIEKERAFLSVRPERS